MHAPRKDFKDLLKVHAAPGEPYVWLTSMGLGIGLLMVAGLLAVILMNGLPVFWPGRVVVVKLKEGVTGPVPNSPEIVGEIVQERTKSVKVLGADGKPAADQKEIQLFVGNKDTYGFSFVFLDSSNIASIGRRRTYWFWNEWNMATRSEHLRLSNLRTASVSRQGRRSSTQPCERSFATVMRAALKLRKSKGPRSGASTLR